jgi:hypothetical protein
MKKKSRFVRRKIRPKNNVLLTVLGNQEAIRINMSPW